MLKNIISKFLSPTGLIIVKPMHNVLCSFVICALFLVGVVSLLPLFAESNDDAGIMYYFADYIVPGSPPIIDNTFTSALFGYIVRGLYILFPAFPCYAIFIIFVMFVSSVVVCYCISEAANKYNIPFIFCILFLLSFLFSFALIHFSAFNFTRVGGFAGSAAIALAITLTPTNERKSLIFRCALIAVFFSLSYIIRTDTLIPVGSILGSILCFKSFKNPQKNIFRKVELILIIVLTTIVVFVDAFSTYKRTISEEFHEWQKYRGQAMDFIKRDQINHDEIGISQIELDLIYSWCFLTENTGKEVFKKIVELYGTHNTTIRLDLMHAINTFIQYYVELGIQWALIFNSGILSFLLIYALFLHFSVSKKRNDILGLFNVSNKLIVFVFFLYFAILVLLSFAGRLPGRVHTMMHLLIAPIYFIMLCALYGKLTQGIKVKVIVAILLVVTLFCGIKSTDRNKIAAAMYQTQYAIYDAMVAYATNNPHNFYVRDLSTVLASSTIFRVYATEESIPSNLLFWGGWSYFSTIWYKQLRHNGMEFLNWRSFLNDNVFLMTQCYIEGNEVGTSTIHPSNFSEYISERLRDLNVGERLGTELVVGYELVDVINRDAMPICVLRVIVTTTDSTETEANNNVEESMIE